MKMNLTQCGIQWSQSNDTFRQKYMYNGSTKGVVSKLDWRYLITVSACKDLCGKGRAYYEPIVAITTAATWILPTMGLLLQAPYESNHFRRTVRAMLRWLGSPISSITCVLWNIKILDKCALLVDMAMASRVSDDEDTPFSEIRDSLYILSAMNQFQIQSILPGDSAAEVLLRIALFSNSLHMNQKRSTLPIRIEGDATLPTLRKNLALELRSKRRHGSVPVFVSLFWFLAALAFSLYFAFGSLGVRATALNLAMGLMLSWIPVFILACIVHRNPYGTERVQELLNEFIEHVAESVRDRPYGYLMELMPQDSRTPWLENLHGHLQTDLDNNGPKKFKEFFIAYAGQGRKRWHYGIAHSILVDVEKSVAPSSGRGWFQRDERVRDRIIRGPADGPTNFHNFSLGELWQAAYAVLIVEGTIAGAFTLAYCTPTYGLGCRSGSFMIFMILTFVSFITEFAFWFDIDRKYRSANPSKSTWWSRLIVYWREPIMVFLDLTVTSWLLYIVLAQTVGSWETCDCVGSTWGRFVHGPGGYIDLLSVVQYKAQGIALYWGLGTATSMGVMFGAMVHIVIEWCTQSHLSTENYSKALRGLKRTRRWKRCFYWLYLVKAYLWACCMAIWWMFCEFLRKRSQSATSTWRKKICWEPMKRGDQTGDAESFPLRQISTTTS